MEINIRTRIEDFRNGISFWIYIKNKMDAKKKNVIIMIIILREVSN